MFHSLTFDFKKPALLKKGVGVKNTYSAIASTAALDRHKEILVSKGVITDSFMSNPVMLDIHDSRKYPVGKVTEVKVTKESVEFSFEFADTEEGQKLEKLYNGGFMNAFSVGFIPKNYIDLYDMRGEDGKLSITSLEVELPNGEKELIDLTQYKEVPYGIISKWELLEVSPVSVPANPEALMIRAKDDIVRKYLGAGHHSVAAKMLDVQLSKHIEDLTVHLNELLDSAKEDGKVVLSPVVPYQAAKTLDVEWDAQEARATLVRWASADGTGDKDSMDWTKYAQGFGWVDLDRADKFTSYQYCHHTIKDDEFCVVWRGLTEAMMLLLANQSIEGSKEVYEHLVKHYAEFNATAPEFKAYTDDELKQIGAGESLVKEAETEATTDEAETAKSVENAVDVTGLKSYIEDQFSTVKDQISELEQTVRLRMNILGKMFDELHKELMQPKQPSQPVEEPTDEAKLFAEKLNLISSLFEDIHRV